MGRPRADKERQISYDVSSMWNLKKNNTNELIYKTEVESQTGKTNLIIKKDRGRYKLGFGIKIYILLYRKQITNKDILYNMGAILNIF